MSVCVSAIVTARLTLTSEAYGDILSQYARVSECVTHGCYFYKTNHIAFQAFLPPLGIMVVAYTPVCFDTKLPLCEITYASPFSGATMD
mgnify:CR=1 FL=1